MMLRVVIRVADAEAAASLQVWLVGESRATFQMGERDDSSFELILTESAVPAILWALTSWLRRQRTGTVVAIESGQRRITLAGWNPEALRQVAEFLRAEDTPQTQIVLDEIALGDLANRDPNSVLGPPSGPDFDTDV